MKRVLQICIGLCAATACGLTDGLPGNAELVNPPAVYALWWDQVQSCSEKTRDLRELRWFRVPGASFTRENGHLVGGYYSPGGNYIALSDTSAANSAAVRHEMLHALLNVRGHPREYFLGACSGLIDCQESCVTDAGKWSAPGSFTALPAESLAVTTTAEVLPRTDDGQIWLTVHILAESPKPFSVVVVPIGMQLSFSAVIASNEGGLEYNLIVRDSSDLFFAAGARKERVFDFLVAGAFGSYAIPPGQYVIQGGFGQQFGPNREITVLR